MKKIWKFLSLPLIIGIFAGSFILTSCEDEESEEFWKQFVSDALYALISGEDFSTLFGWLEQEENLDEIESDIILADDENLPSRVNLDEYFPPIGNQGEYGTCVSWATAYNLRTFLDAYNGEFSPATASNQYSPKDLFWAIPNSQKGADCNGTNFEPAFDIMVERGVAKLSDVPYRDLGDCSNSPPTSWDNAAEDGKLIRYRKIFDKDKFDARGVTSSEAVNQFRSYLAQGRAVAIGARLGDNFMMWDNDVPISSDTYLNPGMQHAYHAMTVSGYDDSKWAFRVVNSWDTQWGSNGYIWVDYDFFIEEFCFAGFVASAYKQEDPDQDGDNVTDELTWGYDLLTWELIDYEDPDWDDPLERTIEYNAFNAGSNTITASQRWNIVYLYYNAYDAEDYDILLYDVYTDEYGQPGEYDLLETGPGQTNYWNHVDVEAGYSVARALGGDEDDVMQGFYRMPEDLSGTFYLVVIADGYDVIDEENEENNYSFANGEEPVEINDGIVSAMSAKSLKAAKKPVRSVVTENNRNTYSTDEIRAMLRYHKKTGELDRKIKNFKESQKYRKKRIVNR